MGASEEVFRKRSRRLSLEGQSDSREAALSLLHSAGDAALVNRGIPRWFLMLCPCGCAEQISINLDHRTGPAWRYYQNKHGFTLFPSVWRESGCKSHFIIWSNRILWFDGHDDEPDDEILDESVLQALSQQERHFADVAFELDQIPWAVLASARRLVRRGLVQETYRGEGGWFKLY